MDLNVYVHLIFLGVMNIIFTFTGIVSNTLVIANFLEIVTTSKEIMSFHGHGVVVFRFGRSRNDPFRNAILSYLMVNGGL